MVLLEWVMSISLKGLYASGKEIYIYLDEQTLKPLENRGRNVGNLMI